MKRFIIAAVVDCSPDWQIDYESRGKFRFFEE